MNTQRKTILGVPVDAYKPGEMMPRIEKALQGKATQTAFAVNAEKIMRARRDPQLFSILNQADFLLPDGFGPVVGLQLIHREKVLRMTGFHLMKKLLETAARKGHRVFLFGSRPPVIEKAAFRLKTQFPSLNLVGFQHGYIPASDYPSLVERINSLQTEILLVGLGSPKQEQWIHRHKKFLQVKICTGVGGSFDVVAGAVPLAPSWVSRMYLEWIFRLIKEPRRINRQKVVPVFIARMLMEALWSRIHGNKKSHTVRRS